MLSAPCPIPRPWLFLLVLFLWGCGLFPTKKTVEVPPLSPVTVEAFPRFVDDMALDGLSHAIHQSLFYYRSQEPSGSLTFGNDAFTVAEVIASLENFLSFILQKPSEAALNDFISSRFVLYLAGGDKGVRFTGYYEPFLEGSRTRHGEFVHAVHGKPRDLVTVDLSAFSEACASKRIVGRWTGDTVVPYPDRAAILSDDGLSRNAEILAWVRDPVALFFLHVQGSGRVVLDDGTVLAVQYAASNGRPYRSIGKWLIDQGRIGREEMSMQAIRAYLAGHPEEIPDILNLNPSYVFFKVGTGPPKGSIGVPLTPGRSIATDSRLFPKGVLAFIRTQKPIIDGEGRIAQWQAFSRFVVNQDTGGAIRGPARADVFWGNGPYAEIAAGYLQHGGEMYFLAPLR